MRAPNLRTDTGVMMVEVGALLGSLRGLKLVPSQWRCLVPEEHRDGAQSRPPALITLGRALRRGATRQVTRAFGWLRLTPS